MMGGFFYKEDLIDMKSAIKKQDIVKVGEIAERSALKMHALNLSANPPFIGHRRVLKRCEWSQNFESKGILFT